MEAIRIIVTGRVRGVWFRAEAKRQADVLGLTGWVRNTDDGGVEALAQGDADVLLEFERWCHRGPPAAQIERVVAVVAPIDPALVSFDIRYE